MINRSTFSSLFQCEDLSEETVRRLLIGYHCAVTELDERIGILLDKLEELGLKDDTIVCYTSDHGEQMGYHGLWWKCTMFEPSVHIPLIVRIPRLPHRRISDPVNLTDWFPTVCELFQLPIPDELDGESLCPFWETGQNPLHKDFAFSEYHAHGMPYGMFMIRWKHYKYIYYCYHGAQLFDLACDPLEDHSLLEPGKFTYGSGEPPEHAMVIAEECHKRLLSVCNPYETDARARDFQKRVKHQLGITAYDTDMGNCPVPHPQVN